MSEANNEQTILDYLNEDCWREVLDYVPVLDIIRTERASRRWQGVVLRYLRGVHIEMEPPPWIILPYTATPRKCGHEIIIKHNRVCWLKWTAAGYSSFESWTHKLGPSVVAIYCDSEQSLNMLGNCPNLEAVTLTGLPTRVLLTYLNQNFNWLQRLCFRKCDVVSDDCVRRFMLANKDLEELEIDKSNEMTGHGLINKNSSYLKSLVIRTCFKLNIRYLCSVNFSQLRKFEMSSGNGKIYDEIQLLFDKMPKLEYVCVRHGGANPDNFYKSVCRLRNLQHLCANFDNDVCKDEHLEAIARGCPEMRTLMVTQGKAVTGRGLAAVYSSLGAKLTVLGVGFSRHLTDDDAVACIRSCPNLQELMVCGCLRMTSEMIPRAAAARRELRARTPLRLRGPSRHARPPEGVVYEELSIRKY